MGLVVLIKTVCQLAQVVTATEKFAFQQPPKYGNEGANCEDQRHRICTVAYGGPSRPRDVQSG